MGSYAHSEETREKLIMTAGELFYKFSFKSVTTRMIAAEAEENIGTIHYHFSGKDGLFEAVLDYAFADWRDDPFGRIVEKYLNPSLQHKETVKAVRELAELIIRLVFNPDKPSWCGALIFQVLQQDYPVTEELIESVISPLTNAYVRVYRSVHADADFEDAHAWALANIAPFVLLAVNRKPFLSIQKTTHVSRGFVNKLKDTVVGGALATLH